MKKSITVLGSTGSIGVNTLDVISRHTDKFDVFALTGAKQFDLMFNQCLQFKPQFVVMVDQQAAKQLQDKLSAEKLPTRVLSGASALCDVASDERVDMVMAAIVGAAGLASCMAAALAGKRLLLANKEALVVGAELFMQAVHEGGAKLLPIDSEHSAIFQSLPENPLAWPTSVSKIILTASGGPFRSRSPQTFKEITPEQACAHPNWVMGRKISVDSATMMNKALEVIEAKFLFGVSASQVEVVIHPQSIIHSMVQFVDGSIVAQLGTPDMRMPISYGLAWPERISSGASNIDFKQASQMTFESMDDSIHQLRYPGLALAWQALAAPAGTTAVLNAANEVAVDFFLQQKIRFDQIHAVNLSALAAVLPERPQDLHDLLEIDDQARAAATTFAKKLSKI
ncbi:MAG: 1-deoxy-D-xylulose-5-phosphate reductoisomerase [Burkholderiales bacterium]|nr:1-deoxy-D-xylulose-5-phosphate reductoisomerase [Burkholderiales bacterium]